MYKKINIKSHTAMQPQKKAQKHTQTCQCANSMCCMDDV